MQGVRLLTGLGRRFVVAGILLVASGVASAAELPLAIPAGARIGIIDMMPPDVTHFHIGATAVKSFQRTYRAPWTTADVIDEPLIWSLTNAGLEPVALQASDLLPRASLCPMRYGRISRRWRCSAFSPPTWHSCRMQATSRPRRC